MPVVIVTCLDHRVDPAIILGLRLGDAVAIRNTGFLADPGFRHQAAESTGMPEAGLEAAAVTDPHASVRAHVECLLAAPSLSPQVGVSGHVYDISTERVTTVI